MSSSSQTLASVSTTGKLAGVVGYAETNVHLSVTRSGKLVVEGIRRASTDEEIVAELDVHERRALRDALDKTL